MGLQRLNEKKVRRLSTVAGIEFVKAAVNSDGREAEAVTADDVHYRVDRRTGWAARIPDDVTFHWVSCRAEGLKEALDRLGARMDTQPDD